MANKNPWIKYILILIVALALLGINGLKNKKYEPSNEKLFKLNSVEINEISFSKDTLSVTLQKSDTTWFFAYPDTGNVSQDKVEKFFENIIEKGERTGYQTDNPENYERYNITDEKATKVMIRATNDKVIEFFTSRSEGNWTFDYVRFPNDPKVYITSKKIMYYLSEKASFWR